jgi:WD40 repeat protein
MNQEPPLVLTKNIRIILSQFGIFVLVWSFTVIDYGAKGDGAPLLVEFVRDASRSQSGLLTQIAWWLRSIGTPRPTPPPFVRVMQPTPAETALVKALLQAPVGKPRMRLDTPRFRPVAPVRGLAVSPVHKILASCGLEGRVSLWDANTGVSLRRLRAVGNPLECVAFTNDGRFVAAADALGALYLWEVGTGGLVRRWQSDRNAVLSIAFAPDGRTLASVGLDDEIFLWEVPSGTKLRSWRTIHGGLLAFSPDGKTLAASVPDGVLGSPVMLLDAVTGAQRRGPDSGVALAFSPDGRTLAIGGHHGSLRLWELATGKRLHALEGHSGIVIRVAFSPDGKTLASLSSEVRLWDVATGKERCQFRREGHRVLALAFSDDGKTLFTGGDDNVIRRWEAATGTELEIEEDQAYVTAVAIAPDGKTALTGDYEGIIRGWDLRTGQSVCKYLGHEKPVQCLAYSPDGCLLASGTAEYGPLNGELRLWEAGGGKELQCWDSEIPPLSQIRFLSDAKVLVGIGNIDGLVRVWDTTTGKELHQVGGIRAAYSSFAPDGAVVALWGPQAVQLWDVANRRLIGELRPESSLPVFGMGAQGYKGVVLTAQALSPGGQYLACAAPEGGIIHVFKVATGPPPRSQTGVWERGGGEEFHLPQGHVAQVGPQTWRESVTALDWSHDGKILASGGGDGRVLLWDLATATVLLRCEGHEAGVRAMAFSSDDRTLVSGSDDRTALVWDLTGVRDASKKQPEQKQH